MFVTQLADARKYCIHGWPEPQRLSNEGYLGLDESFSHEHVLANENQIGHHDGHWPEEGLQTCVQRLGELHDTFSSIK